MIDQQRPTHFSAELVLLQSAARVSELHHFQKATLAHKATHLLSIRRPLGERPRCR
jgi:hypothetical protein